MAATYTPSGPRVSPSSPPLAHPSPLSLSLTPSFASLTLSLTPSHGGAPSSPPPLRPFPFTGASPEHDVDELHYLHLISLELEASPSSSSPLPLPQASSKEDELELHQALPTIFKDLPVLHLPPVSSYPSPIHLHCPRFEPLEHLHH